MRHWKCLGRIMLITGIVALGGLCLGLIVTSEMEDDPKGKGSDSKDPEEPVADGTDGDPKPAPGDEGSTAKKIPVEVTSVTEEVPVAEGAQVSEEVAGDDGERTAVTGDSRMVYVTPNGKLYHADRNCSSLSRSKNIIEMTLDEAIEKGKSNPCKHCAE